jgi:hypothetical protein
MSKPSINSRRASYLYKVLDHYMLEGPSTGLGSLHKMATLAGIIYRGELRLQRIGERECNGVPGPDGYAKWDEADQAQADKERSAAIDRITSAFKGLLGDDLNGGTLEFQGDPRGCMVHYIGPDGFGWYFSGDDFK